MYNTYSYTNKNCKEKIYISIIKKDVIVIC